MSRIQPTPSLIVILFLLFTGAIPQSTSIQNAARAKQEEDIREAMFRRLIKEKQTSNEVYLHVEGKDPSKELLSRFKGHRPPILPGSAGDLYVPAVHVDPKTGKATFSENPTREDEYQKARKTGRFATSFSLGKIVWHSDVMIEVKAAYYCGLLCAGGYTVILKKKDARWVVEKFEMEWIS